MPKFANFVQVTLVSAITIGATSIEVEAQAPFNLPPDPAGEKAYLTLMDDVNNPTAFEIISYTGTSSTGTNAVELTGVMRAEQGTSAQAWDAGAVVRQDITSKSLSVFDDVLRTRKFFVLGGSDASLRVIDSNGVPVWEEFVFEGGIQSAAVGINGDIAIKFDDGGIAKFDKFGNRVWTAADFTTGFVTLAVASDGTVFASEAFVKAVRYSPDGVGTDLGADKGRIMGIINGDVLFTDQQLLSLVDHDLNPILSDDSISELSINQVASRGTDIAYTDGFDIKTMDRNGNIDVFTTILTSWFDPETTQTLLGVDVKTIAALPDGSIAAGVEVFFDLVGGGLGFESHLVLIDRNGSPVWTTRYKNNYFDELTSFGNWFISGLMSAGDELVISHRFGDFGGRETRFVGVDIETGNRTWGPQTINTVFPAQESGPAFEAPIFKDGFESKLRYPRIDEVGNVVTPAIRRFSETAGLIATPPTGKVYVFLDAADGAFKVKFDNGVVKTIATP